MISSRSLASAVLVALALGVEAQLEQVHELLRQHGVRRQHVVLVALGEARADPLAVLAVGAQDLDLVPVEARRQHEPVERVGLRVAAPDRRDAVGHAPAVGLEVERLVARAEHAEVLHPGLAVAALEPRRDLLDHPQAEVLEHRHRLGELDLAARLVEPDPGALAGLVGLVLQADHERLAERLQPREAADVVERQLRAPGGLVVAREARPPLRCERGGLGLAVARDQPVAQLVVPGAGERDDLALELPEVDVGQAGRGVHAEVHLHAIALAEHEVRVDGRSAEALAEVVDQALEQLAVIARAGERDDQRGAAAVRVTAAEQPHLLALQREQRHDRAPEVVRRSREQLVLGERVEQRDRGLVVVGALDQVLGAQDLAQLAVQQRRLARGLGVGLGGEQPEHPRLADDVARGRDPAHAHVVEPHAPVHAREPVRLGDDQQVALERALAHVRRQRVDRGGLGVLRARRVGEDPEPRAGDDRDLPVGEAILAEAQEDEVVVQQPLEEGDRLVDLVVGVARSPGPRELHHPARAVRHRGEVLDRAVHVLEHAPQRLVELLELLRRQPAVEVEVHDRLAPRRLARVQDGGDAAVRAALDPEDRVQHALRSAARAPAARRSRSRPGTASPPCWSRPPSPASRSRAPRPSA